MILPRGAVLKEVHLVLAQRRTGVFPLVTQQVRICDSNLEAGAGCEGEQSSSVSQE